LANLEKFLKRRITIRRFFCALLENTCQVPALSGYLSQKHFLNVNITINMQTAVRPI